MKAIALLLNALLGFCDALPYKYSAIPLGAIGAIWQPIKFWMLATGGKADVDSAQAERLAIEEEVGVMFAKRATRV